MLANEKENKDFSIEIKKEEINKEIKKKFTLDSNIL